MAGIFINYRRTDSDASTGRLYDRLAHHFGRSLVFQDYEDIAAGSPFESVIADRLRSTDVVLVVIGPTWLDAAAPDGTRRLAQSDDSVRTEVRLALQLERRVVPVLVQDASLPTASQLPSDIASLVQHNARLLRPARFIHDVDELADELRPHVNDPRGRLRRAAHRARRPAAFAAVLLVLLILTGVYRSVDQRLTDSRPQMGKPFNLAVAGFDVATSTATRDPDALSDEIGDAFAAGIGRLDLTAAGVRADELEQWGPHRTGKVSGADEAERQANADALATRIDADVLIYGRAEELPTGRFVLTVGMVARGPSGLERADPALLHQAFTGQQTLDPTRFGPDDVLTSFPALPLLGEIIGALASIDRDDPRSAVTRLDPFVRTLGSPIAPDPPRAAVEAVLGLAHRRLAESTDAPDELDQAGRHYATALQLDTDFTFAELGALGVDYFRALGAIDGDVAIDLDLSRVDWPKLRDVVAPGYRAILERAQNVVTEAHVRNMLGQILLLEAASASDPGHRRDHALAARREFEAVLELAAGSKTLALETYANAAQADLGIVATELGDYRQAITHFEQARRVASPLWHARHSADIGVLQLRELGMPCPAAENLQAAIDGLRTIPHASPGELAQYQALANEASQACTPARR